MIANSYCGTDTTGGCAYGREYVVSYYADCNPFKAFDIIPKNWRWYHALATWPTLKLPKINLVVKLIAKRVNGLETRSIRSKQKRRKRVQKLRAKG